MLPPEIGHSGYPGQSPPTPFTVLWGHSTARLSALACVLGYCPSPSLPQSLDSRDLPDLLTTAPRGHSLGISWHSADIQNIPTERKKDLEALRSRRHCRKCNENGGWVWRAGDDSGTPQLCFLVGRCVQRGQWGRLCPACPSGWQEGMGHLRKPRTWCQAETWPCLPSFMETTCGPGKRAQPREAEKLGVPKDGEAEGAMRKCCDLTGAQGSPEKY